MSVEEIDKMLEHKHQTEDRRKYKELKEDDLYEEEIEDLPHQIYIKLHR